MVLLTYSKASRITPSGGYLPALTGLRAVAAYLVFLHHYNPAPPATFMYRLFDQGYIGVSIFFVLSGFLIYHGYADAFLARKNWSWTRYLQNRFARLFPLYIVLLLITVSINTALNRPMSIVLLSLNITLLKGFFEAYKFSGIAQSWSLTVELCFYLLAPLLFAGLRRMGAIWLTAVLVSIGLLLWVTTGQIYSHGISTPGESTAPADRPGFFGSLPFVLFYTFFGRSFEFVAGMWLAQHWQQKSFITYCSATYSGLFIIVACGVWQANLVLLTTNSAELLWNEVLAYNCLLPVGISVFFLGLLRENSIIRYVLSLPILQALGRSSYAFYLIHIGVIADGFEKVGVTNTWLLFSMLTLTAHGLYRFIEKPLHRSLRIY